MGRGDNGCLLLKALKAIFVETTGSFLGPGQEPPGDFFDSGSRKLCPQIMLRPPFSADEPYEEPRRLISYAKTDRHLRLPVCPINTPSPCPQGGIFESSSSRSALGHLLNKASLAFANPVFSMIGGRPGQQAWVNDTIRSKSLP